MLRILVAIAAGLAALNAVLVGLPGDALPQEWIIAVSAASAFLSAVVVSLMGSVPKA